MTTRKSGMYQGKVHHARLEPFRHRFEYRVYYGLFDIDELSTLDRKLRWFSLGRFNLFSFNPADHGPGDGSDLRAWAEQLAAAAGANISGGRIELLAFPRVLGYVFNPISVWYCYDAGDNLRVVLHEVRNTFGHRHTYVVPVAWNHLAHSFDKRLHVSPFNDMDESYSFVVGKPGERLTITIDHSTAAHTKFRAGLALRSLALTDRNLLKLFLTHPLLTLKVIGGIHWQALRLLMKGAKYRQVPPPPPAPFSIVEHQAAAR